MMTEEERAAHLQKMRDRALVRDFPFRSLGHDVFSWPRGVKDGDMIPCVCYDAEKFGDNPQMWTVTPFGIDLSNTCGTCGEHLNHFSVNKYGYVGAVEECKFKGAPTVTEFTVKSGRLIIDDDLRDVFKDFNESEEKFVTYNSKLGQKQVIEYMNAQGCAYGPVGNSSPGLYKTGNSTYIIANPAYDDETDEPIDNDGWEKLGWFCTDLWAYSMADYDDYLALGGRPIEELDAEGNWTRKVIDFPNGTYRITHHTTDLGWTDDFDGDTLYASIVKID